nr:MAG TPA: Protealysin propeptide [Caudoviricetes sp.]
MPIALSSLLASLRSRSISCFVPPYSTHSP